MQNRRTKRESLLLVVLLVLAAFPSAAAEATYYRNNTVCSRGFYLRNLENPPTDKWYMATPLDISRDSTQVIDLIAGNFTVIGSAEVVVLGDELTVSYHYLDGVEPHSEQLMLYTNPDEIDVLETNMNVSSFRFGEKISISRDLGGRPLVLLYINNAVSFSSLVKGLKGYTSLGIPEIKERIAMASSAGLADDYRERVPVFSAPQPAGDDALNENGCIGGVCPIPTIQPKP